MKRISFLLTLLALCPQVASLASAREAPLVFRDPFELHLEIDGEEYYRQQLPAIPYVHNGIVYLFKGDLFLATAEEIEGGGLKLQFLKKLEKDPDVGGRPVAPNGTILFKFYQVEIEPKKWTMMLRTTNGLERNIVFDAAIVYHTGPGLNRTSIIPVGAGISSYEMWPDPIVQLMLSNFRFVEKEQ